MARRYPVSNEFFFLLAAEVAILITIPYIDWVLVNEVILKSNAPLLPPVVASYAKAFEAIKWAVILPTVALVALYKRDILSVTVWTVSAYVPFATGTEDLVYYIIGQRALPQRVAVARQRAGHRLDEAADRHSRRRPLRRGHGDHRGLGILGWPLAPGEEQGTFGKPQLFGLKGNGFTFRSASMRSS